MNANRGNRRGAKAYQSSAVKTASKEKVLLMLYEGLFKFIDEARVHIEAGDYAKKGEYIVKSLAILNELQCSLNFNIDKELCSDLDALYSYISDRLTDANFEMSLEALDEARELLVTLYEGFKVAVEEVSI